MTERYTKLHAFEEWRRLQDFAFDRSQKPEVRLPVIKRAKELRQELNLSIITTPTWSTCGRKTTVEVHLFDREIELIEEELAFEASLDRD